METVIYKARPTSNFNDKQAENYGAELERLQEKMKLTPENIVVAASKKRSPLHDYFEWDNGKAGQKYRLWQARYL